MITQDFARVRVLGAFSRGARGGTPRCSDTCARDCSFASYILSYDGGGGRIPFQGLVASFLTENVRSRPQVAYYAGNSAALDTTSATSSGTDSSYVTRHLSMMFLPNRDGTRIALSVGWWMSNSMS